MSPDDSTLYIFVEGPTDQALLERHIIPRLRLSPRVRYIQYRTLSNRDLRNILKGTTADGGSYVFLRDQDDFGCYPSAIARVRQVFKQIESRRVHIVIRSVEGWYFGGLTRSACSKLGVNYRFISNNTSDVRGSTMSAAVTDACGLGPTELLYACLDVFDLDRAKARNSSLHRFCSRLREEFS